MELVCLFVYCRWSYVQLQTETESLIQWEPFPASINNLDGLRYFVQSFLILFEVAHLSNEDKHCLRQCLLLAITPPPEVQRRLKAPIPGNLTNLNVASLMSLLEDLVQGNTHLPEMEVNHAIIHQVLIPEASRMTGVPPCPQCWHPQPRCVCQGRPVTASYTPMVAAPPVHTTMVPSMGSTPQSVTYGGLTTPSIYASGTASYPAWKQPGPEAPPMRPPLGPVDSSEATLDLPHPAPGFGGPTPPLADLCLSTTSGGQPPIRQSHLWMPQMPYIQWGSAPNGVIFKGSTPATTGAGTGKGRSIVKLSSSPSEGQQSQLRQPGGPHSRGNNLEEGVRLGMSLYPHLSKTIPTPTGYHKNPPHAQTEVGHSSLATCRIISST